MDDLLAGLPAVVPGDVPVGVGPGGGLDQHTPARRQEKGQAAQGTGG